LQPLVAPRVQGLPLRVLTFLLETPPFSRLLVSKLYSDSQFYVVRSLANHLKITPPSFVPLVAPTLEQQVEHERLAKVHTLEHLVKNEPKTVVPEKSFRFWSIED
jgi:hypothetical protein